MLKNWQESGNAHGCPVSFLLGLPGTDFPEFGWVKPVLKPDRLVYVGLRDADEPEKKLIRDNSLRNVRLLERYKC